jgi:hypothetical protein
MVLPYDGSYIENGSRPVKIEIADMIAILEGTVERATWIRETSSNGRRGPTATGSEPASRWDAMMDEITAMQDLGEDWDGLGAKPPSQELLQSSLGLAHVLEEKGMEPPSAVSVTTSGSVVMVWQGPGDAYCEVELTRPFHGEVMILEPGKEPEHFEIPNA